MRSPAEAAAAYVSITRPLTCDDLAWLYVDGAITLETFEANVETLLREEDAKALHEAGHRVNPA